MKIPKLLAPTMPVHYLKMTERQVHQLQHRQQVRPQPTPHKIKRQ